MSADDNSRARAIADKMYGVDNASRGLGITIEEVRLGYARLSLTIGHHHTNGHGVAHGGFIFTLADSAFAFACNSHNQNALAQHCSITFTAPGKLGETLVAEATERHRAGRSGICDVTVRNGNGETIAEFRGHSRTIKGVHFEE